MLSISSFSLLIRYHLTVKVTCNKQKNVYIYSVGLPHVCLDVFTRIPHCPNDGALGHLPMCMLNLASVTSLGVRYI